MPRMKKHTATDSGWTEWVTPVQVGYRMGCCDCGLVHDFEFAVLKVVRKNKNGTWQAEVVDWADFRVKFRVKRNNRSTSQVRRNMGELDKCIDSLYVSEEAAKRAAELAV